MRRFTSFGNRMLGVVCGCVCTAMADELGTLTISLDGDKVAVKALDGVLN